MRLGEANHKSKNTKSFSASRLDSQNQPLQNLQIPKSGFHSRQHQGRTTIGHKYPERFETVIFRQFGCVLGKLVNTNPLAKMDREKTLS
jgi:hypothetical protein